MKLPNLSVYAVPAMLLFQMGCSPPSSCENDIHCISGTAGDTPGTPQAPVAYPLTASPYTALQQVWSPQEPSVAVRASMNSGAFTVYQHTQYEAKGLGATLGAGIPWIEHSELAPNFIEGTTRYSLAYFWVVADPQLIDEESPIRMDGYDKLYRPHGQLTPQTFEAHVRTAQRISDQGSRGFDFAVVAGDLTDSTQKNELDWLLTALNGGVIDPDSGLDNDPIPGPGNDYNDPFISDGISAPWYAALGNHDVLHIGGFGAIDQTLRSAALDDHLFTKNFFNAFQWPGYVAGDTPNHDVILSPFITTPADPARLPLYQYELLQALHDAAGAPTGHGLTQSDVNNNIGYFSVYPVAGKPIKMIVLDTTDEQESRMGYAQLGSMDTTQYNWLQQELVTAAGLNEIVIIVSHHRLEDFHSFTEVPANDIKALLANSANVILHITGHKHTNDKQFQSVNGTDGYWELMTASTMDFPMQSRAIELVYEDNGYLSIYVTNFDHNSAQNSLADKARQLAAGKLAFGDSGFDGNTVAFWASDVQAQNLLLRLSLDTSINSNLAAHTWPSTIESVQTLSAF